MANIGPYLKGNKDKNNRKDKTITKKNVFCGLCSIWNNNIYSNYPTLQLFDEQMQIYHTLLPKSQKVSERL